MEDELVILNGEPFQELNPLGTLVEDELHDQSSRSLSRRFISRSAECIRVVIDPCIAHGVDEQVLHAPKVVTHNSNVIYNEKCGTSKGDCYFLLVEALADAFLHLIGEFVAV
jgi:hypothetical protein